MRTCLNHAILAVLAYEGLPAAASKSLHPAAAAAAAAAITAVAVAAAVAAAVVILLSGSMQTCECSTFDTSMT